MTTDLETRLAAALHARADQVTPDLLRPEDTPRSARRPWRWAVAGLVVLTAILAYLLLADRLAPSGNPLQSPQIPIPEAP